MYNQNLSGNSRIFKGPQSMLVLAILTTLLETLVNPGDSTAVLSRRQRGGASGSKEHKPKLGSRPATVSQLSFYCVRAPLSSTLLSSTPPKSEYGHVADAGSSFRGSGCPGPGGFHRRGWLPSRQLVRTKPLMPWVMTGSWLPPLPPQPLPPVRRTTRMPV